MRQHSASITSEDEREAAYAAAVVLEADAQRAYDNATQAYAVVDSARRDASRRFRYRYNERLARTYETRKTAATQATADAYRAYADAQRAEQRLAAQQSDEYYRVTDAYMRHWEARQGADYNTLSDAVKAATDAYTKAQERTRGLAYVRGLQPISDKNNGGECVIARSGAVYMVPQYQDHTDVIDAVSKATDHSKARTWVRVERGGRITNGDGSHMGPDDMSQAQLSALMDVAGNHMAYAETIAAHDSYTASNHRGAYDSIMRKISPPPDENM